MISISKWFRIAGVLGVGACTCIQCVEGQMSREVPQSLSDSLSSSVIERFHVFGNTSSVRISGTAQRGDAVGRFTITISGETYILTLPEALGEDKEVFVDHHGNSECDVSLQGKSLIHRANGICGFPLPWFYPFISLGALNTKMLHSKGSKAGDDLVLSLSFAENNFLKLSRAAAELNLSATSGLLQSYKYTTASSQTGSALVKTTVIYGAYQKIGALSLPMSISRSIDDLPPLVLTIEGVEGGLK